MVCCSHQSDCLRYVSRTYHSVVFLRHAVKMVDSCSREMEFCALWHDHDYYSFTTRVSGRILHQMSVEVLMNCTKYFDLSSSLTASCVARFMICWVCRLYFSGLVCSVLSLDKCLIKINSGRFCVAPRKLFFSCKSDCVTLGKL